MSNPIVPGSRVPISQQGGPPSRDYYRYLQSLNDYAISLKAQVDGISIPASPFSQNANVLGYNSVQAAGTLKTGIVQVSLVNDVSAPGNTQYYGTNSIGGKGWNAVSDAFAASSNISLTVGSDGVTTPDLTNITVSAGGTLKKRAFDAKGRLSYESAATTDDLTEGATNLYYTDARASAAAPPGYIDGLKMQWDSATGITVSSGAAYIEGSAGVLLVPSAITKSGLSLTASTWYHLSVFDNAGTPDVDISTTAPAAPYNGTARSKTGDTSKRYIGSILTDASGNIYAFHQSVDKIMWESNVAPAPFLVISAGRATSDTSISCAGSMPITSRIALLIMATVNSSADAAIGNSNLSGSLSSSNYLQYVGNGIQTTHLMPVNGSQQFTYKMLGTTTTGGFYARLVGFIMER